jgi:hypothetical protein
VVELININVIQFVGITLYIVIKLQIQTNLCHALTWGLVLGKNGIDAASHRL